MYNCMRRYDRVVNLSRNSAHRLCGTTRLDTARTYSSPKGQAHLRRVNRRSRQRAATNDFIAIAALLRREMRLTIRRGDIEVYRGTLYRTDARFACRHRPL